jgi:hypothetical protein
MDRSRWNALPGLVSSPVQPWAGRKRRSSQTPPVHRMKPATTEQLTQTDCTVQSCWRPEVKNDEFAFLKSIDQTINNKTNFHRVYEFMNVSTGGDTCDVLASLQMWFIIFWMKGSRALNDVASQILNLMHPCDFLWQWIFFYSDFYFQYWW